MATFCTCGGLTAQVASVNVSVDKARTAAIYRRPCKDFEEQASGGRPSALHLARSVPLQGGMPILHGGEVIGAIGVSSASSADEDQELAVIGSNAGQSAASADGQPNPAVLISRASVEQQFVHGGLLLERPGYTIDAGRRAAPGDAELHEHTADIMHVVEGEATVLTGGEMIDQTEVKPSELRARAITGGTSHQLAKGDILVIPGPVAHQFVEVSEPFLYLVVKVGA